MQYNVHADKDSCPCGSGNSYEACCGRYHNGEAWPGDAETMVRARYCAYATQNWLFLVNTHLPREQKDACAVEDLARMSEGVRHCP